jgi:hypothetical protein
MREIKFRAWHGIKKRMLYGARKLEENASWVLTFCEAYNLEPMQYTGLNDIDSKEVYEGDIIETTYNKYVCRWNKFRCEYAWYSLKGEYIYPIGDVRKNIKIIGNIYENPELLEVK